MWPQDVFFKPFPPPDDDVLELYGHPAVPTCFLMPDCPPTFFELPLPSLEISFLFFPDLTACPLKKRRMSLDLHFSTLSFIFFFFFCKTFPTRRFKESTQAPAPLARRACIPDLFVVGGARGLLLRYSMTRLVTPGAPAFFSLVSSPPRLGPNPFFFQVTSSDCFFPPLNSLTDWVFYFRNFFPSCEGNFPLPFFFISTTPQAPFLSFPPTCGLIAPQHDPEKRISP